MGCKILELKMPTGYSDAELQQRLARETGSKEFTWQVENKSLDARKKDSIHWLLRVAVHGAGIKARNRNRRNCSTFRI